MVLLLQEFNMTIIDIPSKDNMVADFFISIKHYG